MQYQRSIITVKLRQCENAWFKWWCTHVYWSKYSFDVLQKLIDWSKELLDVSVQRHEVGQWVSDIRRQQIGKVVRDIWPIDVGTAGCTLAKLWGGVDKVESATTFDENKWWYCPKLAFLWKKITEIGRTIREWVKWVHTPIHVWPGIPHIYADFDCMLVLDADQRGKLYECVCMRG